MKRALIAVLAVLALSGAAEAQTYAPPRAADGHPDFSGVWSMKFLGFLQRSKKVATLIVPPEQEADVVKHIKLGGEINDPDFDSYNLQNLPRVKGTIRSSFLVEPADGRVPFSPKAIALNDQADKFFDMYDNPEERDSSERCVSGLIQAPVRPIPMYMPVLFVQTPDGIVMQTEDVVGSRIVHMSGQAPPAVVSFRDGWAQGRWEGDVLVVETTNFSPDAPFITQIGPSLIVGPGSRVIERFERVSETELFYASAASPAVHAHPAKCAGSGAWPHQGRVQDRGWAAGRAATESPRRVLGRCAQELRLVCGRSVHGRRHYDELSAGGWRTARGSPQQAEHKGLS